MPPRRPRPGRTQRPAEPASSSAWLHPGGAFTIAGFGGYVAGSCSGPAGWICSVRLPGAGSGAAGAADLADATPADGVVDLVWTYVAGPFRAGTGSGVDLGRFHASSWRLAAGELAWTAQGGRAGDGATPGAADPWSAAGQVAGPAGSGGLAVASPGSLALAALALAALATVAGHAHSRTRMQRSARHTRRASALSARRRA